jgi:hypothetical protein
MKDFKGDIKKMFESKKVLVIMCIIGVLIIFAGIFKAGETIGFHRASFRCNWGSNYEKNFGMMRGFDDLPNANGSIGKIIKVELSTIVVQDRDGLEKVILIGDDTVIRLMMQNVASFYLKVNDSVVVIGSPNAQGQIEAKLIRIMPAI